MTHAEKLQAVRKWIVKACPELKTPHDPGPAGGVYCVVCRKECTDGDCSNKIGIAEVLRAVRASFEDFRYGLLFAANGAMLGEYSNTLATPTDGAPWYGKVVYWDFAADLNHQKPDVVDFLFGLLPPSK